MAGWHTLYNHGALTALSGAGSSNGRRASIRKTVRRAQQFREALQLLGKDDPKHLGTWQQLL
jgi:hypothetical protein